MKNFESENLESVQSWNMGDRVDTPSDGGTVYSVSTHGVWVRHHDSALRLYHASQLQKERVEPKPRQDPREKDIKNNTSMILEAWRKTNTFRKDILLRLNALEGNAVFSVSSRGIGKDWTPGCFVCGGEKELYFNISMFVQSKTDGESVVSLFKQGAKLDWRQQEPGWIQVKIGACEEHLENLETLNSILENGVITEAIITQSMECKTD